MGSPVGSAWIQVQRLVGGVEVCFSLDWISPGLRPELLFSVSKVPQPKPDSLDERRFVIGFFNMRPWFAGFHFLGRFAHIVSI